MVQMLLSNFEAALQTAINDRREVEREHGYTSDSILVAGWVEILQRVRNGEQLELIQS